MKVWRVGHESALDCGFPSGPYTCKGMDRTEANRLWGMADDHCNYTHPSPRADPLLRSIASHERCGFDSRDALNTWFDGWTETLNECSFVVWEYDVPDWAVRVGKFGQVVFIADEAVQVSRHSFKPEQLALSL
ncbi:hypothetical protein AB0O76_04770 [Streptomyces sp. NPDC086554]|uniref:hypothetical protein n=1 Tax=Streptomyces sp. NPDC086554 TaxID=3154864 RepID=UPI00342B1CF7